VRNLLRWTRQTQPLTGPDPGRSWRADELWVVDLETTGLNLRRDKIISYGAVPIRGGRIRIAEAVYSLVGIADNIPPESARIHCIRTQDLSCAPPLKQAVTQLHSLIGDDPIIAHCAVIERILLRRAYHTCGLRMHNDFIDTATLAGSALGETVDDGAISLEYAADALDVPVHAPHHALGDAITTANVFLAVAARLERRQSPVPLSTAALIDRSTS
jgi:DNA polymerase III subunit epsilon